MDDLIQLKISIIKNLNGLDFHNPAKIVLISLLKLTEYYKDHFLLLILSKE